MRISDWSSDVCSSDLGPPPASGGAAMTPVRKKRLYWILALVCGASAAVALALSALRENINLFYTPSQIATGEAPHGTRIRAGRSEEHTSELQSLMRISYAVFCLKKKTIINH